MSILTRREAVSFVAGFLSYPTAAGTVYDYPTALGLAILASVAFLAYRALRRLAGALRSRSVSREVA